MNVSVKIEESSRKIGRLYPVLEDHYGNIIDGEHRLEIDSEWPRVRLQHIVTEKERVVARLVSNVCRRSVSSEEKTSILRTMSEILLKENIEPGEIAKKIAEETGMSYRWVTKYLPREYKDDAQSERASSDAQRKPAPQIWLTKLLERPQTTLVRTNRYVNSEWSIYSVKHDLDEKIEVVAKTLGTTRGVLVQNILEEMLRRVSHEVENVKMVHQVM